MEPEYWYLRIQLNVGSHHFYTQNFIMKTYKNDGYGSQWQLLRPLQCPTVAKMLVEEVQASIGFHELGVGAWAQQPEDNSRKPSSRVAQSMSPRGSRYLIIKESRLTDHDYYWGLSS